MHDELIGHADSLTPDAIVAYAEKIGLNKDSLKNCMQDEKLKTTIKRQADESAAMSVSATPTFLIAKTDRNSLDGELVVGAQPL